MEFMTELGIALAKVVFLFSAIMGMASLLTWQERKQSAVMQDRIGANRADILGFRAIGLFQIAADGIKMFFKQDFVPRDADRFIFTLAPMAALFFRSDGIRGGSLRGRLSIRRVPGGSAGI